ncbi:hypothetical protein [Aquibacillus kalidii]|uniref:hypothetical protein n=1 Tax=Aquibacillus kalidii TaxID=2762597 RepID=UPI001645EE9E|nr:hypothetical protein [Aquibacillus kalidii]
MRDLYIVGGLILMTLITHLFIRNDKDENNQLTKKGQLKFGIILLVIAVSAVITVGILNG